MSTNMMDKLKGIEKKDLRPTRTVQAPKAVTYHEETVEEKQPVAEPVVAPVTATKEIKKETKKSGATMERDFVSVNIGDGVREDLNFLCQKYAKQTGKKSVGYATYIRHLIEQDIENNRDFLEQARQLLELMK